TRKAPASIKELSKSEILKLLALRPQSVADIESGFCESSKEILKSLLNSGRVTIHTCAGVEFYKLK
ncbi:MAG: radical SAM protein, partial [Campylobacter sp.]|nr:radical SAM protein [Campylobacter sp.]